MDALQREECLGARPVADADAAGRPELGGERGESVVSLGDHDELTGHVGDVVDRLHTGEEEDGLSSRPEKGPPDPIVRLCGLPEARQRPLEAGQVLEV
jgi:hypothetical protein